ncbi:MAG: transketolase C-terminal domain-containing protein [Gammaproteobacteria bacterium]
MLKVDLLNTKLWSKLGQRGTFGQAMLEIAKKDAKLMVLTADLTNTSGLEKYKNTYPDKFLNVGIAEQNMLGIAAGMAKEGRNVFATSFSTFVSMRSYEQVRLGLGYMGLGVKVIGLASGFAMGMFGSSHYGFEDISLMRSVPGLTVLSPADCTEVMKTMLALADFGGPAFVRLTGTMNNPIVYTSDYNFEIGKAVTLKEGRDIAIIATGSMVHASLKAAEILEQNALSVAVINMHTIKPLDTSIIDKICRTFRLIVTVEEHSAVGGLGSAIAEYKTTLSQSPPQYFIGLPDKFCKAGDYQYLLEKHGLTSQLIAEDIAKRYDRI